MRTYISTLLALLCLAQYTNAQNIPQSRLTDWSHAGYNDSLPDFGNVVNIVNHGAKADGVTADDAAFTAALNALNGQPGTVYFPAGSYLFNQTIMINRDSLIIRGDGNNTKLLFDLGGAIAEMIDIRGTQTAQSFKVKNDISKDSKSLELTGIGQLSSGDYLLLRDVDTAVVFSNWAYGTTGQIVKTSSISSNTVQLDQALRRDYLVSDEAEAILIEPVQHVGIECLYLERKDATSQQTNNINFHTAAYCWVSGVESNVTNFSHVSAFYSSHLTIRGNYFHHAHAYGGGGQAYGVTLQYASGDCLVENNIFEHLRHSMLIQAGANGNVFAYNYSIDPFWDQAPLPNDAAGDIVCHGNYPYLNLFEGNICQSIVIDDSHGINGPFNTFFRNRAKLYGIYTNANIPTDSVNYIGNEVTNTTSLKGNYTLNGKGHYEYGNNIKGVIIPAGTDKVNEESLYLNSEPGYWLWYNSFPAIGEAALYNLGNNTASSRYSTDKTDCMRNPVFTGVEHVINNNNHAIAIAIAPNPVQNELKITLNIDEGFEYSIYNLTGQMILNEKSLKPSASVTTYQLVPGIYILEVSNESGIVAREKFVKH